MTLPVPATSQNPYSAFNLSEPQYPVLLSVPHAGRTYPSAVIENLAVPARHLLRLEDRLVDRLTGPSVANGVATVIAHRPRAWIDLNRHLSEIDPAMVVEADARKLAQPSRKVRGGLGLIPNRLNGVGNLWRKKWQWSDVQQRIKSDYEPYHSVLADGLQRAKAKFGAAILLDLHSMPSLGASSEESAKIVIGDRFGRSADGVYSDLALSFFKRRAIAVQLNHPYSGGHLLERHGNPDQQIHAIQVEVDRACYLDAEHREPGAGLSEFAEHIWDLVDLLRNQITGENYLEAAE